MGCRLVLKSVTLNNLERRNGSYCALFQRLCYKPAFRLITASSSIELIDQNLASTHRAVNLVYVRN